MSKPASRNLFLILIGSFALVCLPGSALAQRGGGSRGGGGGFHGGGGGGLRGGGGFSGGGAARGGGGFGGAYRSAPAPRSSGSYAGPSGGSRSYAGPTGAGPSGGANARPNGSGFRPYTGPGVGSAGGARVGGGATEAPRAQADGQWHSFGGSRTSAAPAGPRGSVNGAPASNGTSGSNRGASGSTGGATRSWSGQGGQVFETTPRTASGALSMTNARIGANFGSTFGPSRLGLGFGSSALQSNRFGLSDGRGNFGSNRGFNNFGFNRGFNNFGFRNGFFGGCFDCGLGFGFGGFGFGSPWWGLGFGWNDPFWFDPWWYPAYDSWWGWGSGYYGPSSIYYGAPYDEPYYDQPYDSNQPYADAPADQRPPADTASSSSGAAEYPQQAAAPAPNPPSDRNDNAASLTLLYLRDGSVLTVTDVWLTGGGVLYYTLANGSEATLDMDRIDLPRTVSENGMRGVPFILRSAPETPAP